MAKVSAKEKLRRYSYYIDLAVRNRREQGFDDLWRDLIGLYSGKQFDTPPTGEDRIAVNLSKATIDVIVPSVSINHPKIICTPTTDQDSINAAITEVVANYQWRHHNFQKPISRAVKDSLIMGLGIVKCGWRYAEQEVPLSQEEFQQEVQLLDMQAEQFAAMNPDIAGQVPTTEEVVGNAPTTKVVVVEDRPFVERVSIFDLYVDPQAITLDENACWVAQRLTRPLDEAKKDKKYSAAARDKLEADGSLLADFNDREKQKRADGDAIDRVTIWEFYDLKAKTMCVFANGADDYLISPRPMPYTCGHPYVLLPNYEVPDRFYPMGELEAMQPLQDELNKIRSQMMNARKKGGRKYFVRENLVGPEARNALQSDEDNVVVPITDDTTPMEQIIVPVPLTQLPADYYKFSEIIEQDIDRVTGINEYQRGSLPEVRRTATEASIIQDAANARAADKLAGVEAFIGQVARKVIMLNQQYLSEPAVARIAGPQGALWVPYTREDIQGEFDFAVEAGSTLPNNETAKRQNAMALQNIFAPYVGILINPDTWLPYLMREMGVKQPEQFMVPGAGQQMMLQQQMQQQQENQANQIANQQAAQASAAQAGKNADQPNQKPQDKNQVGPQQMGLPPTNGQGNGIPPQVMQQLMAQMGLNLNTQNAGQRSVTY